MSNKTEKSIVSETAQAILLLSGITLVILKAAGYIDWSWWVVLIPLYIYIIPLAIVLLLLLFAGGVVLLAIPFIILGLVEHKK